MQTDGTRKEKKIKFFSSFLNRIDIKVDPDMANGFETESIVVKQDIECTSDL